MVENQIKGTNLVQSGQLPIHQCNVLYECNAPLQKMHTKENRENIGHERKYLVVDVYKFEKSLVDRMVVRKSFGENMDKFVKENARHVNTLGL